MPFPYRSYDLSVRLLRSISPLAAGGESKVARGIRGRRDAVGRLADWARDHRAADRPLVWFHAPSVGEGLQARAVLGCLNAERADLQSAYTHFSPSAEGFARGMPSDVASVLPWDTRRDTRGALDALRPGLLAFTKTEVWPTLARESARRGVPVVLIAATLPATAGRMRKSARVLLSPVYGRLDRVLAISNDDAERFLSLGVQEARIEVTGDPAIDSAWTRARAANPEAPHLAPFHRAGRPTVVAGSTWPADEEVLVPGATELRARVPRLLLIVAPHEPTEAHLAGLEARFASKGWRTARLGGVEERGRVGDVEAVLVDRVGVLAELYTVADASFVGGGFHSHGLHSVLEPAAAGLPVSFGPGHANARAASDLLNAGGAFEVAGSRDLSGVMTRWLGDGNDGRRTGERARRYIEAHAGAAARTGAALMEMLPPGPADARGPRS